MNDTNTLSRKNWQEVMSWLENVLTEKKLNQREIFIAQLLIEENFLQLEKLNSNENFSAKIVVKKRFSNVNLELSALGEVYNPFNNLGDLTADDKDYSGLSILQTYKKQIKLSRKNGENIVIIKVHESEDNRTRRIIFGLLGGIVIGLLIKSTVTEPLEIAFIEDNILTPIQTMLIHAIILFTTPMIFFSVLSGFSNISNTASLTSIGRKLVLYSLPKLAFYVMLGFFVGNIIGGIPHILQAMDSDFNVQVDSDSILKNMIVNIVPGDIITPFYTNNILQMLFLACLFGILLTRMGNWADWGRNGIEFFSRFFMEIINVIVTCIPLLAMVSMIKLTMHTGLGLIIPFGKLIIMTALGLPLSIIFSAVMIYFLVKLPPLPFIKKISKFIPLPFSLSDSTAAMPATLDFCHEKLGMESKFAKFSIPIGMQLNMDGTAYYVSIIGMMMAHTFGINVDFEFCVTFFLAHFLISLTGIGLLAMPSIYASFGIPEMAVAAVIGIEPILDMFGTAQSVAGNITSSFLLGCKNNAVDKKSYEQTENLT